TSSFVTLSCRVEQLERHPGLTSRRTLLDDDDHLPSDRVRRGGRRVLTSAAPTVTERDGDRCRCGRGVRDLLDIDECGRASPNGTTARRHQPAWAAATSKCETVVSRSTRYSSSSG